MYPRQQKLPDSIRYMEPGSLLSLGCTNNTNGTATLDIDMITKASRLLRPRERDSGKIIASGMVRTIPSDRATRHRAIVFKTSESVDIL